MGISNLGLWIIFVLWTGIVSWISLRHISIRRKLDIRIVNNDETVITDDGYVVNEVMMARVDSEVLPYSLVQQTNATQVDNRAPLIQYQQP